MSSSPTASADANSTRRERLVQALESTPDPRARRGRRYRLAPVRALAVTAVLAGARSYAAIGQWITESTPDQITAYGLDPSRRPDESTLRKLFARLEVILLDRIIGAWIGTWTRTDRAGRTIIAVDGKTLRGARTQTTTAPHLVAGLDHTTGTVLGQLGVDSTTNEIPTVRDLLDHLDIAGAVVTLDAMHTQVDTAERILGHGGDYVFTVKGNQPTLRAHLAALPWNHVPPTRDTGHHRGHTITRTIKVLQSPDWIDFPGARQVAQLRRTRTRRGKRTVEVVYLITSAPFSAAPPHILADWVRNHWAIENKLHYVRDVTFDEDHSTVRTGNSPHVMATLRNTAISLLRLTGTGNIAHALRHHARHPDHAIKIVLNS